MIIILSGNPGKGKTWQSMAGFDEEIVILDCENRDEDKRKDIFSDRLITVIECKKIHMEADVAKGIKKYGNDYLGSYFKLLSEIDKLIENHDAYGTIVIDGITDIRNNYAKAKWHNDNPTRKNPRPEEWGTINKDVAVNFLTPMINMCRIENINLVMTAQMKNKYVAGFQESNGKLVKVSISDGQKEAFEDWQAYDCDVVINLDHPKKKDKPILSKYIAHCTKSPVGAWEQDITGICLYDLLLEMGL